jgi:hypothetical protein
MIVTILIYTIYAMKRLALLTVLVFLMSALHAQRSIDELFKKYAGKDGFVTVSIDGDLLKLAASLDEGGDNNLSKMSGNITHIRILASDDENMPVENFYDAVIKDLDLSGYEEFMKVKESEQDMRMLVRTEGTRFREFLLIAGGKENAIIQIKGNLSRADAKRLSEEAKKNKDFSMFAEN